MALWASCFFLEFKIKNMQMSFQNEQNLPKTTMNCLLSNLSAWGGCWFVVYIRRFIYKFLNVCPFDYTAVAVSGKVGP